jgi:fatty-acyl-CoA synthase
MMEALPDLLAKRAALGPDRIAFEHAASGALVSYAALNDRANRAARVLADLGVGAGDVFAVLCRNRSAFFELMFAAAKRGAILTPLNFRAPPGELAPLLQDCGAKLLIFGAEDAGLAQATAYACARLGLDDPGPAGYEALLGGAAPWPARAAWPARDCWCLIYTSGTTGRPKGVIQTYGMSFANYVNTRSAFDIRADDVTLNFLPLCHTAGINLNAMPTLYAGGRVVTVDGFQADVMLGLVAQGRLSTLFAVPAVYQQLALHPDFARTDFSKVRAWGCGGAPLPDALVDTYRAVGVRVRNGMGMTETGPTVFLVDEAQAWSKVGSVGKPQILAEARIVRPDGSNAAPGETGELWFAGPNVTPGYWNQPEATAAAFAPGGWLKSGDLARTDADGDVYVVGRSKEMFISGGANVYPAEVENVLALAPGVLEAAVVGVPDARWGEVGKAYVLRRPDAADITADALSAFVRERLATYKTPAHWVFVSAFPRTPAGKVQKHKLAELG